MTITKHHLIFVPSYFVCYYLVICRCGLTQKWTMHVIYFSSAHQRLSIKHLITEPLNAAYLDLAWLFLQTLLMSICCKRHVQSPLVSPNSIAIEFVLTLCTSASEHLSLDSSSRTRVWHVTWPIMAGLHLVCQTELSLVETRPTHIRWCDSRGTWMPTPVRFTTQCTTT